MGFRPRVSPATPTPRADQHGEIKNLEMPGMTMVFQVKDPTVLDTLKTGDKVKFRAEKAGGGLIPV